MLVSAHFQIYSSCCRLDALEFNGENDSSRELTDEVVIHLLILPYAVFPFRPL